MGTSTLTDTNVYENRADTACLPFERSLNYVSSSPPMKITLAHDWQGGGLVNLGTAMLTNTNVYANQAGASTGVSYYVCSPS